MYTAVGKIGLLGLREEYQGGRHPAGGQLTAGAGVGSAGGGPQTRLHAAPPAQLVGSVAAGGRASAAAGAAAALGVAGSAAACSAFQASNSSGETKRPLMRGRTSA